MRLNPYDTSSRSVSRGKNSHQCSSFMVVVVLGKIEHACTWSFYIKAHCNTTGDDTPLSTNGKYALCAIYYRIVPNLSAAYKGSIWARITFAVYVKAHCNASGDTKYLQSKTCCARSISVGIRLTITKNNRTLMSNDALDMVGSPPNAQYTGGLAYGITGILSVEEKIYVGLTQGQLTMVIFCTAWFVSCGAQPKPGSSVRSVRNLCLKEFIGIRVGGFELFFLQFVNFCAWSLAL